MQKKKFKNKKFQFFFSETLPVSLQPFLRHTCINTAMPKIQNQKLSF